MAGQLTPSRSETVATTQSGFKHEDFPRTPTPKSTRSVRQRSASSDYSAKWHGSEKCAKNPKSLWCLKLALARGAAQQQRRQRESLSRVRQNKTQRPWSKDSSNKSQKKFERHFSEDEWSESEVLSNFSFSSTKSDPSKNVFRMGEATPDVFLELDESKPAGTAGKINVGTTEIMLEEEVRMSYV